MTFMKPFLSIKMIKPASRLSLTLAAALLLGNMAASPREPSSNWGGHFPPCERSSELLKHGHMEVGVFFNTSNQVVATEFRRAMDFWSDVLDMTWHEVNTGSCSIQVVDGTPALFKDQMTAARSQFTDLAKFHGWIAFNPRCPLNEVETYLTAIHEIGHMLGLEHSSNPKSVMFFLDPESPPVLDGADLAFLASRHKLRTEPPGQAGGSSESQ